MSGYFDGYGKDRADKHGRLCEQVPAAEHAERENPGFTASKAPREYFKERVHNWEARRHLHSEPYDREGKGSGRQDTNDDSSPTPWPSQSSGYTQTGNLAHVRAVCAKILKQRPGSDSEDAINQQHVE